MATGGGTAEEVTKDEAIERYAAKAAGKQPARYSMLIATFESDNQNLSEHIMGELTGTLFS
ncbi:MAG: hypothetical protein LBB22_02575 [Treponema sp.]|jgi:hypothetical protein|nr:hypothetical protein [Treponema sp.]